MSIVDIILTLVGIVLIIFAFLFTWSMCMMAKADNELTEFLEHKERFGKHKGEL